MSVSVPIASMILILFLGLSQEPLVTVRETNAVIQGGLAAVETTVINNADIPLSAWKIAIEFTLSNRKKGSRAVTRDVFGVVSGIDKGTSLPAHGSAREVILVGNTPGVTVQTATARVELAVFTDGTWIGSESDAAIVFEQRQREQDAWDAVAEAMRQGLQTPGVGGLKSALATLNRTDQKDFEHPVKRVIRRNLERALSGNIAKATNPSEFLRAWMDKASVRSQAAGEHKRSKGRRIK